MRTRKLLISTIVIFLTVIFNSVDSNAHCDRKNGPVAVAAKKALKTGDFSKVAIWVGKEQEKELRNKFRQSLSVYQKSGDSKTLAKNYFMETAVRLHREAEGMPFTGLKPAKPAAKDIQVAEKALTTGNLEPVMEMFSETIHDQAGKWFQKAMKSKKEKDKSVSAGRKWVDAYVKYIVYMHKLYQTIEKGPPHGVGKE